MMTVRNTSFNLSMNCCTVSAAAYTSARIRLVQDTVILAVSVFVGLIILRLQLL